jgi:hypothetical protein
MSSPVAEDGDQAKEDHPADKRSKGVPSPRNPKGTVADVTNVEAQSFCGKAPEVTCQHTHETNGQ